MKILYATALSLNDSSLYRLWALERLGHQVIPLNAFDYDPSNPIVYKISYRLAAGPSVTRLNRDLLQIAEAEKPDILWTDKLLSMRPSTLDRMREMGIATVSYMIDNPFGTRRDPGWRLYMKTIPHYDLHVVQRDKNILDYTSRGARDVVKIQTAYEPTLHFAPPEGWSDADRDRDVSFIGTPYDDRAQTLTRLWRECGFNVTVSGNTRSWNPRLRPRRLQGHLPPRRTLPRRLSQRHLALAHQPQLPHPLQSGRVRPQKLRDRRLRRLPPGRALRRPPPALQGRRRGRLLLHLRRVSRQDSPLPPRRGRKKPNRQGRQPPRRSRRLPQRPASGTHHRAHAIHNARSQSVQRPGLRRRWQLPSLLLLFVLAASVLLRFFVVIP